MFTIKNYDLMKAEFNTKVKEVLCRKYKVTRVADLPVRRSQEVQFLKLAIDFLDGYVPAKIKSDELLVIRAKILAGLMYIIADEINYGYVFTDPKEHSGFFTILHEVIGIDANNNLDPLSKRKMMEYTEKFLSTQIIQEGDLLSGNGLLLNHGLLDIPGFSLEPLIQRLLTIREAASKELWVGEFAKHSELKKKAAAVVGEGEASLLGSVGSAVYSGVSGLLGIFGGKAAAPTPAKPGPSEPASAPTVDKPLDATNAAS